MKAGIIFDMDNTVLSSKIDFAKMKGDTARALQQWQALPENWQALSTGELIEGGVARGICEEQSRDLWQHVAALEAIGLHKAAAEPGAAACLAQLSQYFVLTLLTNNLHGAALDALTLCGLAPYFSVLVGRGEVPALKPDPAGYRQIMGQFPQIAPTAWLAVGDAWLDGAAAAAGGIDFAAYDSRKEDWAARGIRPVFQVQAWDQGAVAAFLAWRARKIL